MIDPSLAQDRAPTTEQEEASQCPDCEGGGFVVLDSRYVPETGKLTTISGPCAGCRGTGERVVYSYGKPKARRGR